MPKTTAKATKSATTRPRKAAAKRVPAQRSAVSRTAELSEDVLKSVEAGQRAVIEAVRKFVDTVDDALPAAGGRPSRREAVIDAALEMADRLVTTQYDFLHSVVQSADRSLSKAGTSKKQ